MVAMADTVALAAGGHLAVMVAVTAVAAMAAVMAAVAARREEVAARREEAARREARVEAAGSVPCSGWSRSQRPRRC